MGGSARKTGTEVTVLKSADGELPTDDSSEKIQIFTVEKVESPIRSLAIVFWSANLFDVPNGRRWVVYGRNKFQVASVSSPHYMDEERQAIDRFLDRRDFHAPRSVAMFHPPVVLKEGDIVGHCFNAQDDGVFIIHLDSNLAHMVIDTSAFDTGVKIVTHFILVVAYKFATEKCGDVFRFDRMGSSANQFFIDWTKVSLLTKDNVRSIFDLHEAPMVVRDKMTNDRTECFSDLIELFVKSVRAYGIGQALSLGKVVNL